MFRGLLIAALFMLRPTATLAAEPDYVRDIAPLLRAKCVACHGAIRQKAGLRLDAGQLVLKGTKDGPIVVSGEPDKSSLIEAITVAEGESHPQMPPEGEGEPFSKKDIELFRAWIKAGAKAPTEPVPEGPSSHWAYQVPKKATVPGPGHPIDAFLSAERAKHSIRTNPEADKATLLRRVTLDLIGIPPTPEELAAFLKDDSPNAFEKVVDRLLASPMYGERWGRHWMDIWRYSDPFGSGEEYRYSQRHIWRWRDWIVESLNEDKGYDRMIVEMLAGDEVAPADPATLRATGYLARNWYKFNRNAWVQDAVEYTAAGFLATTMRCARCHDHKYDPISQLEYYRLRAVFEPHDVRTDAVPGQPDLNKDGVARVFDKAADTPTYFLIRGDERMPDKSRKIEPATPAFLGPKLSVNAVKFAPKDFAGLLPTATTNAKQAAAKQLETAQAEVKRATEAVAKAKQKRDDLAAGRKVNEPAPTPFLRDTFAKRDDTQWKVVRGNWAWENSKLICKTASQFATVNTTKDHPVSLMGRIRFKTTGGGIQSVGFGIDTHGAKNDCQGFYINTASDPAVRPYHRVNGAESYPPVFVRHPLKVNEEITLDFAVRGNKINTWVNGQLKNIYTLPIARKPGKFTVWTHDATAEFSEITLQELPESVPLAEKPGEARPSPLDKPVSFTVADAEASLKQAQKAEAVARAKVETAHAVIAAVEARSAADATRLAEAVDEAKAIAAANAEKKVRVLETHEKVLTAEPAKLDAAKKAHADAVAAAAKDDANYTPLVKIDPAGSTGRRLALAKWIADAQNPLTARVAVNHIWLRHFGTPLVASVANFGLSGKKPTHPELLDWLAVEFTESGWSMKRLHRLMVTSQAYRLSSRMRSAERGVRNEITSAVLGFAAFTPNSEFRTPHLIDAENRYYWRANSRRMDAEVVRDSLLAVAGQLDTTRGGPIIDEKQGLTSKRRSLYFRYNAEYKMTFLDQFDAASPTECFERRESVIPQQALALHNSTLALSIARELAKQLPKEEFVTTAFVRILGREPTADEQTRCEQFLKDQAELFTAKKPLTPFPAGAAVVAPATDAAARAREDLLHVLLNHNDFVTIR